MGSYQNSISAARALRALGGERRVDDTECFTKS